MLGTATTGGPSAANVARASAGRPDVLTKRLVAFDAQTPRVIRCPAMAATLEGADSVGALEADRAAVRGSDPAARADPPGGTTVTVVHVVTVSPAWFVAPKQT